jgi:hypothetical protein
MFSKQKTTGNKKNRYFVSTVSSPPYVGQLSRKRGSLNVSQPFEPTWPVTGTVLPYLPSLFWQSKREQKYYFVICSTYFYFVSAVFFFSKQKTNDNKNAYFHNLSSWKQIYNKTYELIT